MPKRTQAQKNKTEEHQRLEQQNNSSDPVPCWQKWGPYVSERAWGTVREDYSADGNAWAYFPHDHARSRTYRWGEDGLAGICDRYQVLTFSLGLWNTRDEILKERLYGLVPNQANHGEDVKEYYFYLDNTPSHSYMKYLYKYSQKPYPYQELVTANQGRSPYEGEVELVDLGAFDENRYFDVFVEYAKNDPEDLCVRIEIFNRGPEAAPIHVLPQLWFRNTWSWGDKDKQPPIITAGKETTEHICICADDSKASPIDMLPFDYRLGQRWLYGEKGGEALFTDNETNAARLWGDAAENRSPWVKDAFHRTIVNGESACNPEQKGTKAGLHYSNLMIEPGKSVVIRLRLSDKKLTNPISEVDKIVATRKAEADSFYNQIHPKTATEDERLVQRQALSGMLWTKQIYIYNVNEWQTGDDQSMPPPASRRSIRNSHWQHIKSMRIFSMPDKWEYPWFAAWDLAFHTASLALVDPIFAKEQLWLLLFEQFQHPNGQIPAYEWEFSDLNPPVQAWGVWRVYNMDRTINGKADRLFLERCFHKLLMNFAWWVNRVDSDDKNVFEGGFLGLDNITVIDRSEPIPGGGTLKQSDGTGWMGMFCLNMMRISLELARENPAYESMATKFFQHYVYVGAAMKKIGGAGCELWSETDGFFYDALCFPDGSYQKFRVRSLVGLIPLYAVERLEESWMEPFKEFRQNLHWFLEHRQDIVQRCVTTIKTKEDTIHVLAIISPEQMHQLLERVWDPHEFRSEYGLRSLSKHHEQHPFHFGDKSVHYNPAEAPEALKGGNSNWRGPIWFPTTFMMIESLRKLRKAYGEEFTIVDPEDATKRVSLAQIAEGFANRLISIFTRNEYGQRPVFGDNQLFQDDPHWRDCLLFYEYFHGDTGKGLGASHQTGWTGLVANLIDEWRE